jgi:hypothetical protein
MEHPDPVKVAVVVGRHPYDEPNFQKMFCSLPGVEANIQNLDEFAACPPEIRDAYDVVLFYNFHMETPGAPSDWGAGDRREVVEAIGRNPRPQGIFILHHAVLAFPDWPVWSEICGIGKRSFGFHGGQSVHFEVADRTHPITQDLLDWDMVDETYTMDEPGADSRVLVTADHPLSMRAIAWARRFGNARVFCYVSGHDDTAYSNPGFLAVVGRGILWLAYGSEGGTT